MLDQNTSEEDVQPFSFDADYDLARRAELDRPPELPLTEAIRHATRETGSGTSWLKDFWRCLSGPGKLTASEYFYYRLYAGGRSAADTQRFVGKAAQAKMHRACCDPKWFAAALDKLHFLTVMHGAGVPVAETVAVYNPSGWREHPKLITRTEALETLLELPDTYPVFAKPIDGMYSVGALSITDGGDGWAHVKGVGQVPIGEIAGYMNRMSSEGYLLQRTLNPHPDLHPAMGGTLGTVRFLVLTGDDGPVIESAVAKIPQASNIADNYWRTGNMLGALDIETGRITRVTTGTGAELRELTHHPMTEAELVGLQLPEWHAAKTMCRRAAMALPGLRTQSWDIALTNRGPVAIEVNWGGDLNLHQLAHDRGVLSTGMIQHLRRNGYSGKLPED